MKTPLTLAALLLPLFSGSTFAQSKFFETKIIKNNGIKNEIIVRLTDECSDKNERSRRKRNGNFSRNE